MVKKLTVDSFFAGVGGIDLGLEQTGRFKVIWANEINKWARQTYALNFPDVKLDSRDINKVPVKNVPKADVMVGGFPCQSFSVAGLQKGFDDPRGILFFQMLRMIKAKHPKIVLLENVKNLVGFKGGKAFKIICDALTESGYCIKWKVMNTAQYGNLPQHRERIYIIGFKNWNMFKSFKFPKPIPLTTSIHDVFDFKHPVPEQYYYTNKSKIYPRLAKSIQSNDTIYEYRRGSVRENKSHQCFCSTVQWGSGGDNCPIIYTNDHKIRALTPRECFNIQGFPKSYKLNESKMHLYEQAGNAVSVPVIKRIATQIVSAVTKGKRVLFDDPAKPNNYVTKNDRYVILFISMKNRYQGRSYVSDSSHISQDLKYALVPKYYISNKTYFKQVRLNKRIYGYMIEPILKLERFNVK